MPKMKRETTRLRHERFINELFKSTSREEAARRAGISVSTVERWFRNPDFVELVRERRREISRELDDRAQFDLRSSLDCLRRNLSSGHAATEVRAALGLAEVALRIDENRNLGRRIEDLENLNR